MASAIGELAVLITANSAGFARGVDQALQTAERFAVGAAQSVAAGVAAFAGWGLKLAAEAETSAVAFEVMLGSAEKAKAMLSEIKAFADVTPFGNADLQKSTQMLLSFGVAGERAVPTLKMLSDIAAGDANKLDMLSRAFGQMSSAGRLMGQDLNQMINAGFNPLQIMAQNSGRSMGELKKQMEAGGITVEMVTRAFELATSEGGAFYQMNEKQSQTLAGQWSTLQDSVGNLARSIGEELLPVGKSMVEMASGLVEWFKQLDVTTVKNTLQVTAFAAAFTGTILIIPKVVAAFMTIVRVLRALATSGAIAQALTGPKGWATLAVSLAAAGAAVVALEVGFSAMDRKAEAAGGNVAKVKQETEALFAATDALSKEEKKHLKDLEKEHAHFMKEGARLTDQLRTPTEKFADTIRDLQGLMDRGAITSTTYARAIEKAKSEFTEAERAAHKFHDTAKHGVGAVTAGSTAAFSAIQASHRELERKNSLEREILAEEKKAVAVLSRIEGELKKEAPKLKVVDSL